MDLLERTLVEPIYQFMKVFSDLQRGHDSGIATIAVIG